MDNYINSVKGESWESLYKPLIKRDCDLDMRYWLAKKEWIGLTGFGLQMINSALAFILKTIMSATGFISEGETACPQVPGDKRSTITLERACTTDSN
jgi:hypothetical protein